MTDAYALDNPIFSRAGDAHIPERPRAYSYVRISSEKQVLGHGPARQLEMTRSYAAANGLDLQEQTLEDLGISAYRGQNIAEGALGKFLEGAREGKVPRGSYLLVENLDRISRANMREALNTFLSIVDAGITIVTLSNNRTYTAEKLDLTDMIVSLSEMNRANSESLMKSQRGAAVWKNKREHAATKPMTATCPRWLRLSKDRSHFVSIEPKVATIRRIFEMSRDGMGIYAITRALNEEKVEHVARARGWRKGFVRSLLSDRALLGEMQPGRVIDGKRRPEGPAISSYYPAVITPELWWSVQAGITGRRHAGGRRGRGYNNIFMGILRCRYCNARIVFERKNRGGDPAGNYLMCADAHSGLSDCPRVRWRYRDFEASALAFIAELDLAAIINDDASRAMALDDAVAALRWRLDELRVQRDRVFELIQKTTSAVDYVAERLDGLEAQRVELERELAEKEQERLALVVDRKRLDDVRPMIEQLRGDDGAESYRLRSAVASRLRSIVRVIMVAPAGDAPMTRKTIDLISQEPNWRDVVEHLEKRLLDESEHRKYFRVLLTSGTLRIVVPDSDDPTKLDHAFVSSMAEGLVRVDHEGEEDQMIPPRDDE